MSFRLVLRYVINEIFRIHDINESVWIYNKIFKTRTTLLH